MGHLGDSVGVRDSAIGRMTEDGRHECPRVELFALDEPEGTDIVYLESCANENDNLL